MYSVVDGVGRVILNRPDKLNTLGVGPTSNRAEILDALHRAEQDDAVGCTLITANGSAFCAGGDLLAAPGPERVDGPTDIDTEVVDFFVALGDLQKVVVAGVHGLCLGAGVGLLAQCDIVISSCDARFGLVEGRLGYPGATELVSVIGPAWSKFLLLTGEMIGASVAERIGLVLTTVEPSDLEEAALDLARRIASTPRANARLNKRTISAVADAMGRRDGRRVGRALDVETRAAARRAEAPDGRRFTDILSSEGIEGMKRARDLQFTGSWLKRYVTDTAHRTSRNEDQT
ncbi:enoyl-CoA hydratase/isomerase family protein [Pedococcus sp. P5_B7]